MKTQDCNTSEATITKIENNKITVNISVKEECEGCAAAKICEKASPNGKFMDIVQANAVKFHVGEKVIVNTPQNKALKAIRIAFLYPIILMIFIMLIRAYIVPMNDIVIAVLCISFIGLYYLIMYFCRNTKLFNFNIFISKYDNSLA